MPKNINRIVILNNIRSNENVGAIFRTADAAGISKIILVGYTPAPLDRFGRENRGLTKASLGAEKNVEWEKAENLKEVIKKLKNSSSGSQNSLSGCSQKCLARLTEPSTRKNSAEFYPCISGNTPKKNFVIVAIEQDKKAIDYREIKNKTKNQNLALVFGNEVDGLSKADLKLCDYVAELPMLGTKESLNVSVCAGIVLYSLL